MPNRVSRSAAVLVLLVCLAVAGAVAVPPVRGTEGNSPKKDAAEKKTQSKKVRKARRRLPNHYADVVNEEQRRKVYKIQEEYQPKIAALRAELKKLIDERNEKIEALLTAEQKEKIAQAKAEARAKRKAKKRDSQ